MSTIDSPVENAAKLFKDASRWPGKAALASDTEENLATHLQQMHDRIEQAKDAYNRGEYGTAFAHMTKAEGMVSHIEPKTGWPTQGYAYEQKYHTESVPAIRQLVQELDSA